MCATAVLAPAMSKAARCLPSSFSTNMRILTEPVQPHLRLPLQGSTLALLAAAALSLAYFAGVQNGARNTGSPQLLTGRAEPGCSSGHGFGGGTVLPLPLPPPPGGIPHFRLPPERLSEWLEYAKARKCSADDSEYEQIFSDLAPFRRAGGISEGSVEAAHAALDSSTLFTLRSGRLANASSWGENRQSVPFWRGLLEELGPALAASHPGLELKLVFNSFDKPRSWTAPLPDAAEAALLAARRGGGDGGGGGGLLREEQRAWVLHGCDGAGLRGVKHMHSAFAHTGVRARRGLFPILSGAKIQGCFSDILVPRTWNAQLRPDPAVHRSSCPLSKEAWESKRDIAFWRGTTTGAFVDASVTPQTWQGYQRQRLVQLSRQHPTHLDAAFTAMAFCAGPQCREMEGYFGLAPHSPPNNTYRARYQVVVDGNSIAARLAASLCSGCLTLMGQLFSEWWAFRLEPYRHFLPLRLDFLDLPDKVQWARQHPAEVQGMVAAAQEFVNTRLREDDIKCYMYRLLLEYADLYRPSRPPVPPSGGQGGEPTGQQHEEKDVYGPEGEDADGRGGPAAAGGAAQPGSGGNPGGAVAQGGLPAASAVNATG